MWQIECTIDTVNVDMPIKIILKNVTSASMSALTSALHQHLCQLSRQHLTLKNKFINYKNYKKQN